MAMVASTAVAAARFGGGRWVLHDLRTSQTIEAADSFHSTEVAIDCDETDAPPTR